MDDVIAALQQAETDLKAALAQLQADGKVIEVAVVKLVTAQVSALLAEFKNLVGTL